MLNNFEKRQFKNGERLWLGEYRRLSNTEHWHLECEIIRIARGEAQIKINGADFSAAEGDCFFCSGEDLHYIKGAETARIDVLIIDKSISRDITEEYTLTTPKIPEAVRVVQYFEQIKKLLSEKGAFYREALEACGRSLIIEIFRQSALTVRSGRFVSYKNLINKINREFSFITFKEAARYSGYSPSHFSKVFRRLTGMTFSQYLNTVRVENAVKMLKGNTPASVTSVGLNCGFSTVRNFNRIFKELTGYSPRNLPADFIFQPKIKTSVNTAFDPTDKDSELI